MLKALSYYYSAFKHPKVKDFIDMGFGIDARYQRSKSFWNRHLELCKNFQIQALDELPHGALISVLGAGSLLDIHTELLARKFSRIDLYDANPSAEKMWNKKFANLNVQIKSQIQDLSGCLEEWTSRLTSFAGKYTRNSENVDSAVSEFLLNLKAPRLDIFNEKPDVVFSVNLLSQIPIYWRDRVHSILAKSLGIRTNEAGSYAQNLEDALEKSMGELQAQHLALLAGSGGERIVLINDQEFLYYTSEHSLWQSEKALYIDPTLSLPAYKLTAEDSWFWHIAPQGIEERDYGCIHDVKARVFARAES